tara:strand:+ start:1221 stop:1787 length:567 start_codon:yes stop_codon:yes gene_type:complete
MNFKELEKELERFSEYVIQQARSRLKRLGKNDGQLYKSLSADIDIEKGMILVDFLMEDYGEFVDQGVKGKNPSKVSPNSKIRGQQAPNSPFKFGSGSKRGTFKKFVKKMGVFAQAKNVRFRQGKTGKFAKGGYKSMGYVIARNIYNRGLKPSLFFTKPFNKGLQRFTDKFLDAFALDIENGIILGTKK